VGVADSAGVVIAVATGVEGFATDVDGEVVPPPPQATKSAVALATIRYFIDVFI
jgi:hypothetical protein